MVYWALLSLVFGLGGAFRYEAHPGAVGVVLMIFGAVSCVAGLIALADALPP